MAGAEATTQARRWAFVLVDQGGGSNLTREQAHQRLFSDRPDSIRSYLREVSYGREDLRGEVLGPFRYDPAGAPGELCRGYDDVAAKLGGRVRGDFDQVLWYLGSPIPGCDWGGVADFGSRAAPRRNSFYNATTDCAPLVQEPGHNFGMAHSSSLRCVKDALTVSMVVPGQGRCQHDEYGNPFDPMGGGSGALQRLDRCRHMNGVQKAHRRWLSGCNVVKATTSGTFTLSPLERSCRGPQLLQIPLPEARELPLLPSPGSTVRSARLSAYYLELRTPTGRDRDLGTPRVLLVAAGELAETGAAHQPNWLIDTTPETTTFEDAALVVGAPFQDPAPGGPRFTLMSLDEHRGVVRVELSRPAAELPGTGTCLDGSPFIDGGGEACLTAEALDGRGGGGASPVPRKAAGCGMGNPAPACGGLTLLLVLGLILRRSSWPWLS